MKYSRTISNRLDAAMIYFGAIFLGIAFPELAQGDPNPITSESLEGRAERIFEAKETISREKASWAEQKPLFESLIALREKEIAGIEGFTESAHGRIEEVSQKRSAFETEETDRKTWRANFEKEIIQLEISLREVTPLLPPPVKTKLSTAIARLEETASLDQIPLQERFRDVLSILSAARDFDSKLTIDSEIRNIDGQQYQIDVLYLGLDRAWFVDASGKIAGTGQPTSTGWIWNDDNGIAAKVRRAIEVNRREIPPTLVSLPFTANSADESSAE